MHVSLSRRSRRVGHSMQYLLWICFGVLAVVPWQVIRGQDEPAKTVIERNADGRLREFDHATVDEQPDTEQPDTEQSDTEPSDGLQPDGRSERRSTARRMPVAEPTTPSLIFRSQNGPPEASFTEEEGFMANDRLTGRSGQAYGALFRAGAITGPAIGRKRAIFPLELMPYAFADDNLFFADIRGFKSTDDNAYGGNFGGGYRRYVPAWDRIFGVNGFFDYDNSSGALFRQLGFGVETLGALFDFRANGYLPNGSTMQQLSLNNLENTTRFAGHNLLVDQRKVIANALHGFDTELGVPLPGPIPRRHDIRVFGGGYWYEGQDVQGFGGWKTRVQGNVIPSVALQLEITNDHLFKTNVIFGATWSYGGFKQSDGERKTQFGRMTTPILRNYNVVVGLTERFNRGVTVINPVTSQPYFFEHVDSNSAGPLFNGIVGDGTVEHPFSKFENAQIAVKHDIIFVHANSVFTGVPVILEQNVRVLGEANGPDGSPLRVVHTVDTLETSSIASRGNTLRLPNPTPIPVGSTSTSRPLFQQSPGTGVVLADNSEFSGFRIGDIKDPTSGALGKGIVGDSVKNVLVRQTDVSFSRDEAVFLTNTSGNITFKGDVINDPLFNNPFNIPTTFHVSGTNGTIVFTSDPLTDALSPSGQIAPTPGIINNVLNSGGRALVVEGTKTGSNVDFTGSTVNDKNGNGILITNDAGAVTLGNINVTNGLGIGVNILNDSGLISGAGTITIDGSTKDAINIENLAAGGRVLFADTGLLANGIRVPGVNIVNRQARGINLNNNSGNVTFATPVTITSVGNIAVAAIEYQGSKGDVSFNDVAITNGGLGILIGTAAVDANGVAIDNTGNFTVNGTTTITNPADIGIEVTDDKSTVTFNGGRGSGVTIGNRGNIGIEVLANRGSVNFNNTTTITNGKAVTLPGVDIRRNVDLNGSVRFATLNVQNAIGPAPIGFGGIGVNIGGRNVADANLAQVFFTTLNIDGSRGTSLFVQNEGQKTALITPPTTGLTIAGGTITSTFGSAVDIENSVINVSLTAVNSSFSPTNGIKLLNDQSFNTPLTIGDFMFSVVGTGNDLQRSGGTIQTSTLAGISLNQTNAALVQTGGVRLEQITVQNNFNGIVASNLLQLDVHNTSIGLNTHNGILATDIPRVDITGSLFTLNGSIPVTIFGTQTADNAIHLIATQPLLTNSLTGGAYIWNISDNNDFSGGLQGGFTGGVNSGDTVLVESTTLLQVQTSPTTFQVTPLVFHFDRNTETVQDPRLATVAPAATVVSGLSVNWIGLIQSPSSINLNRLTLRGADNGFSVINTDTTDRTTFQILGNSVIATGGGNIGISVNDLGPTDLLIGSFRNPANGFITASTFDFTTPINVNAINQDIAMRFDVFNSTVSQRSTIDLFNNTIIMRDLANGTDQGIVFETLQRLASVILDNNNITIASATGEGIVFQAVSGPTNLSGTFNNRISSFGRTNGSTPPFVNFNGAVTTGHFIVNGFTVP